MFNSRVIYKLRVVVSKEERESKGVKELLKDGATIVAIDPLFFTLYAYYYCSNSIVTLVHRPLLPVVFNRTTLKAVSVRGCVTNKYITLGI